MCMRGPCQDYIRCTLDICTDHRISCSTFHLMEGCHELIIRIKRDTGNPGIIFAELFYIDTAFLCKDIECSFCRIPDYLSVLDFGVNTEGTGKQDIIKVFFGISLRPLNLS